MELIDIGVNLGHRSFAADREAVIDRAVAAGVRTMICTGTHVRGSQDAAALAGRRPGVMFATAGVHPHDAARCDNTTIAALRTLAARANVLAIGECGLDFDRDFSPRPVQDRVLSRRSSSSRQGAGACRCSCTSATRPRAFLEVHRLAEQPARGCAVRSCTASPATKADAAQLPRRGLQHRHHRVDLRRATRDCICARWSSRSIPASAAA
jgi:Tat protein secretion system quality control protein TatD with DNase activity